MKKYLLLLFFIIVLSSLASATGTCTLDKYSYQPGETGTFSCETGVTYKIAYMIDVPPSNYYDGNETDFTFASVMDRIKSRS